MNVTVILQDQVGITVMEETMDLSPPWPDLIVNAAKQYVRHSVSDRRIIFREVISLLDLDRK